MNADFFSPFKMNDRISRGGYLACFCTYEASKNRDIDANYPIVGLRTPMPDDVYPICKEWNIYTNVSAYNCLIEFSSVIILVVQLISK